MQPLAWPDHWPTSGPVVLRPWSDDDLATVAELARDPYVPLIGTVPAPYSEAEGRAYVARQHQRLTDGAGWSFAVAERATDRAVGGAGLWLHADRPASAGYAIAPADRGRGFATAALVALTAFAWTRELERVELFVEPGNAASRAVAVRAGYVFVERLAGHGLVGGQPRALDRFVTQRAGPSTTPGG